MKKLLAIALVASAPAYATIPFSEVEKVSVEENTLIAHLEKEKVALISNCVLPRRDFEVGIDTLERGKRFYILEKRVRRGCTILAVKPSS